MSTYVIANDTGANVRVAINAALMAAATRNSGSTAPSPTYAGMIWPDTSSGIIWRRNQANTGWVPEGTLSDTPVGAVTGAITTLGKAYFGRDLMCSGTFGITMDTIANLGAGFTTGRIRNTGSGVVTLNAAASETINGKSSIELDPGMQALVVCDGSSLFSEVIGDNAPFDNTGSGSSLSLGIGQSAYIDVSASSSVPLNIATGDKQLYEIHLLGDAASVDSSATLLPNDTNYGSSFSFHQLYASSSTVSAGAGGPGSSVTNISIGGNSEHIVAIISTDTLRKSWYYRGRSVPASGTPFIGIGVNIWGDTTTLWTSLGTIVFATAWTGRIWIRRVG